MKPLNTPPRDVVLVVDDAADTITLLNDVLDAAGMTVLVALEGSQALAIAERITPEIILLDAVMPNMDGFETCRRLKRLPGCAHVPVIFMTGLSDTEHVVMGLEAGGVDYITKPINPEELVARMRVHLANARLTLSVRAALDIAGHHVFTCDADGGVRWLTPETARLFDTCGAPADWVQNALPRQLAPWLAGAPDLSRSLTLRELGRPLQVSLLGRLASGELLLRLMDLQGLTEVRRLREAFPVTEREAEVLLWIARGKTNREIGQILSLSPRTVNKHLEQVFRKLGVENRTSAAAMALRVISLR